MTTFSKLWDQAPERGYGDLANVLELALAQAMLGKGKERHAGDAMPFCEQPIMQEARTCGVGFLIGQARKKAGESIRLEEIRGRKAAQDEILGAINYLAAAWLYHSEQVAKDEQSK
jgi:hypothetical protein